MSFQSMNSFKKTSNTPLKELIDYCESNNFTTTCNDNYIHKTCHVVKKEYNNDQIEVLQTYINFTDIFTEYSEKGNMLNTFDKMWCGYYKNNTLEEPFFITQLNNFMMQKKIIFVFLDFQDYLLCNKTTNTNQHELVTHSTAAIFYPAGNDYKMFHFNPHGCGAIETKYYEKYITQWRKKRININLPVDLFVMNEFIKSYNTNIKFYTTFHISVIYKPNKYFSYIGPNLQVGDSYGICYTFPFMLFHDLCKNWEVRNLLENNNETRRFPSYKKLVLRGDFHKIIFINLSKIFKNVKLQFLDYESCNKTGNIIHDYLITDKEQVFSNNIEELFINAGIIYIKLIFSSLMQFITQPYIANKIKNIQ